MEWNTKKTQTITNYKTVIPYQVLKSEFNPPFVDITQLYVNIASPDAPTLQTDLKAPILLSLKTEIVRVFFANKKYSETDNSFYYEQIANARIGNLVYLVAECTNMNGEAIIFSIKETTNKLVAANEKLSVLKHQEEGFPNFINYTSQLLFPKNIFENIEDNLTAEITQNFASVAINFHELNTPQYNAWDQLLNTFNPAQTELFIEAQLAAINNSETVQGTTNKLNLKPSGTITQHIYHTGHLSKEVYQEGLANKVNYIYHATDGKIHDLGTFALVWATKWKRRVNAKIRPSGVEDVDYVKRKNNSNKDIFFEKDGVLRTPLVTLFSGSKVFKYQKNGREVSILSETTDREYFNPERLAAVIGAILVTGYEDVVTNGSVESDGVGNPSISHINGNNIDFKYLRGDEKRPGFDKVNGIVAKRIYIHQKKLLDKKRQNRLLNSFYDFGFGRSEKSLSHWLNESTKSGELNHCVVIEALKSHKNHLHLRGFTPLYK